ncbi:type VI secretion system baseplate subunit TssK, partial [Burkholderia thailandensis]|nr:type VI secretion system baseplate subunit TssK [Burkholderia thailandensis]
LITRLCWNSPLRSDDFSLPISLVAFLHASLPVSLSPRFLPPLLSTRSHLGLLSLISSLQTPLRVRLASTAAPLVLAPLGGFPWL